MGSNCVLLHLYLHYRRPPRHLVSLLVDPLLSAGLPDLSPVALLARIKHVYQISSGTTMDEGQ